VRVSEKGYLIRYVVVRFDYVCCVYEVLRVEERLLASFCADRRCGVVTAECMQMHMASGKSRADLGVAVYGAGGWSGACVRWFGGLLWTRRG
jgi:hypothetical protein